MSNNVECKLTVMYRYGIVEAKINKPFHEDIELYDDQGIDCVTGSFIRAMFGLGMTLEDIKKSFDREFSDCVYIQTGVDDSEKKEDMEWHPIETAPKDGSKLLLFINNNGRKRIVIGYFNDNKRSKKPVPHWFCVNFGKINPSHWQHLPDFPKD